MSIIYSYPEQGVLNANDMLIGTSAEKVGGKQKNITRNFSIQQVADFINNGTGIVDPVASDFQIPVFNQLGKKLTGSIMSQDSSPSNGVAGTGITIAGTLATTGSILTQSNLTAIGIVTLGSNTNLISLNSNTRLNGPILDTGGTVGDINQILISNASGNVFWTNYAAGLTYQGVWNAATNIPSLADGVGTNGHFYIVDVLGNTPLDGNTDWQVGDWALFSGVTGAGGFWDKIDNTQSLTGSGTTNTMTMWTSPSAIGDSLISQAGTVVSVNASLKVKDTVEATTANTNLKLKGAGTGGVEIMSADGVTDGRIQLNCSVGTHGVTIQSPPHDDNATYTLILPSSVGTVGQVLTSAGSGAGAQLTWSSPTVGTVTSINYTTDFTAFTAGPGTAITTAGVFTLNKNGGTAGQYIDGAAGAWVDLPAGDTYDLGSSTDGANVRLNLDAASGADSFVTLVGGTGITVAQAADVITLTGSAQGVTSVSSVVTAIPGLTLVTTNQNSTPVITLGLDATAGSNKYLDGGSGQWTTLPVSGVTSVTGDSVTIAATAGNTPVISAITAPGIALGNANLATGGQIQSAINTALSGAITFKGTFDASTGTITGGTDKLYNPGANSNTIAVAIGDMYVASTAGNFFGNASTPLSVGDEVIATVASTISPSVSVESNYSAVPSSGGAFLPLSGGTLTGNLTGTSVTFTGVVSLDGTNQIYFVPQAGESNNEAMRITRSSDKMFFTYGINGPDVAFSFDSSGNTTFEGDLTLNGALTQTTNVDSSFVGNVGIGTNNPIYSLDVHSQSGAVPAYFNQIGTDNDLARFDNDGVRKLTIKSDGGADFGGGVSISLGTGSSLATTFSVANNFLQIGTNDFKNNGNGVYAIGFGYTSGATHSPAYIGLEQTATGNSTKGDLVFRTRDSTNDVATTERMRITSAGNVSIGDVAGAKLSISGSVGTTNGTQLLPTHTFYSDTNTGMFRAAADTLAFSTGGSERMRITSAGSIQLNAYGAGTLVSDASGNITASAAGGASATITTRSTTTVNATTTVFALGATPNGGSTSFVDVFVDGVYQEINTYSVTGTTNITFGTALPSGVTVETKTTADYNVGAAVASVNGMTGSVLLNAPTLVTGNINALNGGLYIFDSATIYTLTLPTSPSAGDSIKISNGISGAANIIAPGSKKIMDVAGNMTINTPAAAFEMIFSGDANGWVIIGNV